MRARPAMNGVLKDLLKKGEFVAYWNWHIAVAWAGIRRREMTTKIIYLINEWPLPKFSPEVHLRRRPFSWTPLPCNVDDKWSVKRSMWMNEYDMAYCWVGGDRGKQKYLKRSMSQCHFVRHESPFWKLLGRNCSLALRNRLQTAWAAAWLTKPRILKPVHRSAVLKKLTFEQRQR